MNHKLYPFDTQRCDFRMRSDEDIHNLVNCQAVSSIQIYKMHFRLQKFFTTTVFHKNELHDEKFDIELNLLNNTECFSNDTDRTLSLSGFTITMSRSFSPYISSTYLPTAILTVASFIGFLIPVDMVPGRMALLVTILLMLVNIKSTERRMGPVVSTTVMRWKSLLPQMLIEFLD